MLEGTGTSRYLRATGAVATALFLLSACTIAPPAPPAPEPEPVIEPEPEIPVVEPAPVEPEPEPVTEVSLPSVAIVLSSRQPAYEDVANELGAYFESSSIYDLDDKSQPPASAFRQINDSDASAVIAVGLRAARSAVAMSSVPVIFSQVFNHHDYGLIGSRSRGVAAIPPVEGQLRAWRDADPELTRVGVVIGPGHDDLLREARVAAERLGLELNAQMASSDQETLYYFKRMVREVDGFWLLPDNRILSGRVLREMLVEAGQRNVTVMVPNRSMLAMGAAVSVSTVTADIASRIYDLVSRIHAGGLDRIPAMTELTEIRVDLNEAVLSKRKVASSGESGDGSANP